MRPEKRSTTTIMTTTTLTGDRGGVSPFIVVLMPTLIALAGLAYDGGMLFAGRREVHNVAAAAARAGASDIDEPSIYAGHPVLAASAPGTAVSFAFNQGVDSAAAVALSEELIEVRVTQRVDMTFLGLFGVDSRTVEGEAQSRVRSGVTR